MMKNRKGSNNMKRKLGIDVNELRAVASKSISSSSSEAKSGEAGALSIINSPKNGKRFLLGNELKERLGYEEKVQFALLTDAFVVAKELPNNDNYFNIRKTGNRDVIYAGKLVKEITEEYGLDYSNRVSITFYDVEYVELDGVTVAKIYILTDEGDTQQQELIQQKEAEAGDADGEKYAEQVEKQRDSGFEEGSEQGEMKIEGETEAEKTIQEQEEK